MSCFTDKIRPETWSGPDTTPGRAPGATPHDLALSPGPASAPRRSSMRPSARPHVSASQPTLARSTRPTRTCPNRNAPSRLTRLDPRSILLAASQGISPACKPARLHSRGAPGASAADHTLRHPPPRKPAVPQVTSGYADGYRPTCYQSGSVPADTDPTLGPATLPTPY